MLKDLESICKGKDKKNKQDISTKRQNNNTKKNVKHLKRKTNQEEETCDRKKKKTATQDDKKERERKKEEKEKKKKEQLKKKEEQQQQRQAKEEEKRLALNKNKQLLLQMNEFIQTDDTVVEGYESWPDDDPTEAEEMTSNEETIQIKAEDNYTKLQDNDSFYGNDVVRKAAKILSVTSGELRAKETRKERPTTAQKCPRSALTPRGSTFDLPLPERQNMGQKCPRQRNMSVRAQTSQMCIGCETKVQELQEARRKIAWLEQQLSGKIIISLFIKQ